MTTRFMVRYTKVFLAGNVLAGLTYPETAGPMDSMDAGDFIEWAKAHAVEPVETLFGSNYRIADVVVETVEV